MYSNLSKWSIDPDKVKQFVKSHYGIRGEIRTLPGEIDLNFKVTTSDNLHFVFKISPPGVDLNHLDFQYKILQYLKYTSYEDSVVQLKGRVACEVNTCDELLLTGKE